MPGDHLDISSDVPSRRSRDESSQEQASGRRFLGVRFACCEVYGRVYVNRAGDHYIGNCPRCAKRLSIRIGPGGTDQRFFTAY